MIFSQKPSNQETDTKLNILADINQKTDSAYKGLLARVGTSHGLLRMVVIAVAVFATFSIINPNVFLKPINLGNMMGSAPEVGMLAIAMMIAMLTAGIDLSVISIANLTTITISTLYTSVAEADPAMADSLSFLIVLVGMLVGMLAGLFNGFLVGVVGITPILATLGTMQLYNGLAIVWTEGKTLSGAPEFMRAIGDTSVVGIPAVFVIFLVVAALVAVFFTQTPLGKKLKLLGANELAATYSGIPTRKVLIQTYVITGLVASLAGFIFMSRSGTANADYGSTYLLLAIVISILGGTNPDGGRATVLGVVLAVLTLQMIKTGFQMMKLGDYEYQIAQGLILILVMVADQVKWKRPKFLMRSVKK